MNPSSWLIPYNLFNFLYTRSCPAVPSTSILDTSSHWCSTPKECCLPFLPFPPPPSPHPSFSFPSSSPFLQLLHQSFSCSSTPSCSWSPSPRPLTPTSIFYPATLNSSRLGASNVFRELTIKRLRRQHDSWPGVVELPKYRPLADAGGERLVGFLEEELEDSPL